MKKENVYKLFGSIFALVGLVFVILMLVQHLDYTHLIETVLIFGLGCGFLWSAYELEKEKKWKLADGSQKNELKLKQRQREKREQRCGEIILKVGVIIIIILSIVAIVL